MKNLLILTLVIFTFNFAVTLSLSKCYAQTWSLIGNNTTTGFLGTTNNADLVFKRNNSVAGRIGATNTSYGLSSLIANTTGTANNSFGLNTLRLNTTGSYNTATGNMALTNNISGSYNCSVGNETLVENTTGSSNSAFGYKAMYYNKSGNSNCAMGNYSLYTISNGNGNLAAGNQSLYNNYSGSQNTAVGYQSLWENGLGSNNTGIGYLAGSQNFTGNYNTFIGALSGAGSSGYLNTNYSTAIGYKSKVAQDNTVVIGSVYDAINSIPQAKVGIGTIAPQILLTVFANDPGNSTAIYGVSNVTSGNGIISECNVGGSAYGLWGKSASGYAGYFSGNVNVTGVFTNPSDEKLKENIQPMNNAMEKISALNPKTYTFKSEYSKMNLPEGTQNGFIAQEVEKVLPELVKTNFDKSMDEKNPMEYKSINYIGMIPVLTEAIKEQQTQIENRDSIIFHQQLQIDALMNKMNQFENVLSQCCSSYQSSGSTNSFPLGEGKDGASLEQNVPNPFNQFSFIKYFAPSISKQIEIVVSDLNGRVVKTFSNLNNGFGTVNISAGTFAAGTYQYTLFIEGNKIDSKQMVIVK